jgi:hypothetical protein
VGFPTLYRGSANQFNFLLFWRKMKYRFRNSKPVGFVEVKYGSITLYSNKDIEKGAAWVKLHCKLTDTELDAMIAEYEKEG